MSDLTEFLLARIAEDEAHASACSEWTACGPRNWESDDWNDDTQTYGCLAHPSLERALADCEAKRALLALHPECVGRKLLAGASWAYDETLRRLAFPYADHPDYQQEWAL